MQIWSVQASFETRRNSERGDALESATENQPASSLQHQDQQHLAADIRDQRHGTAVPTQLRQRTTSTPDYPYHSAAAASRVQPNHRPAKYIAATTPRQRNSAARQVLQCSRCWFVFSARCNIYISGVFYDVSVCLSISLSVIGGVVYKCRFWTGSRWVPPSWILVILGRPEAEPWHSESNTMTICY